ncbi:MAG TPA: UDP-N-acetylmuramoyl-tripeptide--D-alanyl-D-alanine ligase [Edaphocola sp.]|nr:UDP-N-acetylmuramoyl-tripeptide--D-alanyl-D-alanine ligase [Edaphocola sp.]
MEIQELYKIYQKFSSVQTDSRKVERGDLFFALKGENFDGNKFAAQALKDGAAYAVIDNADFSTGDNCIVVEDVLVTLQQLANYHRKQFSIPFIAITGSNGKTTTKELLHQVLACKYITYATEGNLNNHIGVPLTILKIKTDAEIAIIEMGANHQKEIASYCAIAAPNYALINNVGMAHLEGFGGLEGVKKGKGELYDFIRENGGSIFINTDLDYLEEMAHGIENRITYGRANAQVIGRMLHQESFLKFIVLSSGMETVIQTKLVGDYNFPNALAAIAVGNHFDIDIDTMKTAIEQYNPSNNRSQLIEKGNNTIILDAYNANPSSMKLAIENIAKMNTSKPKWLLLGAMKEMGASSRVEHQMLINIVNSLDFENVILVGNEFEGLMHEFKYFENSVAAKAWLLLNPIKDALVLIKGSRGAKMEEVLNSFN